MTIDIEAADEAPRRAPDEELPKVIARQSEKYARDPSLEAAQRLLMLRWRAGAWAVRSARKGPYHLDNAPRFNDVPDEIHVSQLTPDLVRAALSQNGGI